MATKSASANDSLVLVAFRTVVTNCGLSPRQDRQVRAYPGASEKIRSLAGTSPEYQRHVVGRLLAGDPQPFNPIAATLLVYDTVAFREVTSRLHRALGGVRKEADLLNRQIAMRTRPDRLCDRILTLDLVDQQAGKLRELLAAIDVRPGTKKGNSQAPEPEAHIEARLYAASGLGLIAKNVRNVAVLQRNHLPTVDEKALALALCQETQQVAQGSRNAARRAFGRADNEARVRPRRRPTQRVITHEQPDGDAIMSAWLAERFLLADEQVEVFFVPRARVLGTYSRGDCLVDVGNTHDPINHFFDHKPPALPDRHNSCAAMLIWEHLLATRRPVRHLQTLIWAAFAGDSARQRARFADEYRWSNREGLHFVLRSARKSEGTDAGVYRAVRRWLDRKYLVD